MENKLREQREMADMTLEDLAAKSGISRQTISALENGKAKSVLSSTLIAIAEALGTTVEKIFTMSVKSE